MFAKSSLLKVSLIILFGLVLRCGFIVMHGHGPHHEYPVGMDEVNYSELASNISDFGIYGSWSESFFTRSTRSPVYPAILASARLLTGGSPWAPQILNIVLDTLNILLVYFLAELVFGRRTALLSALIYSVFGPTFYYLPFISSDILSVSLFLLFSVTMFLVKRSYWTAAVPLIVISAILIHTKPVFLVFSPVIAVLIFIQLDGRADRNRILKSVVPLAAIYMLCVPWLVRNYRIHRSFVPVCTVVGWHIYDASLSAKDLSIKPLMDYIYSPGKEDFTETDYYNEGSQIARRRILQNPLKFIGLGLARIAYFWFPDKPYIRIFLPKAYVVPIRFGDKFLLPMPDFEGFIYLFFIAAAAALAALKWKKWLEASRVWLKECRLLVAIVACYILAHVPGYPMEQYRFVFEPVLMILVVGLAVRYAWAILHGMDKKDGSDKKDIAADEDCTASVQEAQAAFRMEYGVICVLCFLIILPIFMPHRFMAREYPRIAGDVWDFKKVHLYQRLHGGQVPEDALIRETGVVRYVKRGLAFNEGKNYADVSQDSSVGKLYVRLFDKETPMGIGDIKLNFSGDEIPKEDGFIFVEGRVKTGSYRDLIVDVEKWRAISDFRRPALKSRKGIAQLF